MRKNLCQCIENTNNTTKIKNEKVNLLKANFISQSVRSQVQNRYCGIVFCFSFVNDQSRGSDKPCTKSKHKGNKLGSLTRSNVVIDRFCFKAAAIFSAP